MLSALDAKCRSFQAQWFGLQLCLILVLLVSLLDDALTTEFVASFKKLRSFCHLAVICTVLFLDWFLLKCNWSIWTVFMGSLKPIVRNRIAYVRSTLCNEIWRPTFGLGIPSHWSDSDYRYVALAFVGKQTRYVSFLGRFICNLYATKCRMSSMKILLFEISLAIFASKILKALPKIDWRLSRINLLYLGSQFFCCNLLLENKFLACAERCDKGCA